MKIVQRDQLYKQAAKIRGQNSFFMNTWVIFLTFMLKKNRLLDRVPLCRFFGGRNFGKILCASERRGRELMKKRLTLN